MPAALEWMAPGHLALLVLDRRDCSTREPYITYVATHRQSVPGPGPSDDLMGPGVGSMGVLPYLILVTWSSYTKASLLSKKEFRLCRFGSTREAKGASKTKTIFAIPKD